MNSQLHHMWNSERDNYRGSNRHVKDNPEDNKDLNKITLTQNRPRYDVRSLP